MIGEIRRGVHHAEQLDDRGDAVEVAERRCAADSTFNPVSRACARASSIVTVAPAFPR